MAKATSMRPAKTLRHGWTLLQNRRTLWQMLRDVFSGKYRMSMLTNLVALFAIAYVIFPFDLIPDFIPVVGWIDDGLVVYLLLLRLVKETQRYNRFKAMGRKER